MRFFYIQVVYVFNPSIIDRIRYPFFMLTATIAPFPYSTSLFVDYSSIWHFVHEFPLGAIFIGHNYRYNNRLFWPVSHRMAYDRFLERALAAKPIQGGYFEEYYPNMISMLDRVPFDFSQQLENTSGWMLGYTIDPYSAREHVKRETVYAWDHNGAPYRHLGACCGREELIPPVYNIYSVYRASSPEYQINPHVLDHGPYSSPKDYSVKSDVY